MRAAVARLSLSRWIQFAAAMLLALLVSRYLGVEGKGQWTLARNLALVGAALLGGGYYAYFQYAVASRRLTAVRATHVAVLYCTLWASVLGIFASLAFLAPSLLDVLGHRGISPWAISAGLVGLILTALFQLMMAVVLGASNFTLNARLTAASHIGQLAAVGLALALVTDVRWALAAWILALGASTAVTIALASRASDGVRPTLGVRTTPGEAAEEIREGWPYARRAWVNLAVNVLNNRQDTFLLVFLSGTSALGLYSVAVNACELLWIVPDGAGAAIATRTAAEGDGATASTARAIRIVLVAGLIMGVSLAVLSYWAIPFAFGDAFRAAVPAVWLLLPGAISMGVFRLLSAYFQGAGMPELVSAPAMAGVAANLASNLLLIPMIGFYGAAVASSISYTLVAALLTARFLTDTDARTSQLVPSWSDLADITAWGAASIRLAGASVRRGGE